MNFPWYLSRSAGLVAYLVLFFVVVLGISIRTRGLDKYLARWKVTDLHTFLSLLALSFVALHAGVLLWDGFVGYSPLDILVPFATPYRTVWTAVGISTAYLLALIAVSFPARRWIGYRTWRTMHYFTFLAYLAALAHGVFMGTDSQTGWAQLLYISTASVVLILGLYRVYLWQSKERTVLIPVMDAAKVHRAPQATRRAAAAAAQRMQIVGRRASGIGVGAVLLSTVLFLAAGMGPFRWFSDSAAGNGTIAGVALAPTPPAALGFSDSFSGSATQTQSGTMINLALLATGTGQRDIRLDVELQLQQTNGRTIATSNRFQLMDGSGSILCAGQVAQLVQTGLSASCEGTGLFAGHRMDVEMQFDRGLGSQMTGTLDASEVG